MRRSEIFVRCLLVFVVAYGLLITVGNRSHERFPFFAWDLFTTVPPPQSSDYDIRIVSARDLTRTPVYFEDANLVEPGRVIQGYDTVQHFALSISQHGDTRATTAARHEFEAVYLGGLHQVRYQVVMRTFDIRKRVECRTCFTDVKVLGTYAAS